nr:GH32 C-terminal domain-containing protein [Microbacterium sp. MAH-37]
MRGRCAPCIPVAGRIQLELLATPDGAERALVQVERGDSGILSLSVDRSRSTLDDGVDSAPHTGTIPGTGGPSDVRVFVDRSSIEVFVDGVALTTRVCPTRSDANILRVMPEGGARIQGLRGWQILPQEQENRETDPSPDSDA